jgi:poly(3-hydroxybutyrate) depolymerase
MAAVAGEGEPTVMSRRTLLAAALALPVLAACNRSDPHSTPGPGVVATTGTLRTRHWPGHRPSWVMMRPRAVANPPLVVSLHGKDGDARSTFDGLQVQRFIVATGLAVAAIDGGNYYWHARRSESTGDDDINPDTPPCDTGAMVSDDFVPMLGRLGLDVSRIGLIGWSMGGYGALLLAARMGRTKVAAVAPMSAALWTAPGLSAPGAFDDAEDFDRNDVFAERGSFAGIPVRMACGTSDPFYPADRTFVDGFPATAAYDVSGVFDPGGHDNTFWADHAEGQLMFLAKHLHQR